MPSLRSVVVVAAVALPLVLPGHLRSTSSTPVADATAHVAGSVRKPVKPAKRKTPLPASAADPTPNDPLWRDSWSLAKVRAPAAWRVTRGTAEVVVAVLDTGIDRNHPDLQGSFVSGWDAVNEDAEPDDDHGHGTLVAGVIAARSNNGLGGVGACAECSLMPVKVIGSNGSGSAADIAEGIIWAADHGAHVLNMSFALSGGDDGVAAAIAYAQGRGILVVAAAGNAGTADATFPAAYPGVVGVAATDPSDARYDWSSYGAGCGSPRRAAASRLEQAAAMRDFCGTSSATALVSGLAGLMRSFAPASTTDAVGQALAANALRVGDFVSAGRVDVEAAVGSLRAARAPLTDSAVSTGARPSPPPRTESVYWRLKPCRQPSRPSVSAS